MISNGLNKVILLLWKFCRFQKKNRSLKKLRACWWQGFQAPPPPTRCCIWWNFFSIRIWIKEFPLRKSQKRQQKLIYRSKRLTFQNEGEGRECWRKVRKPYHQTPTHFKSKWFLKSNLASQINGKNKSKAKLLMSLVMT